MDSTQALSIYEGECPGCDMEFTKKRSNQVFCTSRCKNQHHNGKSRVGRHAFKKRSEVTKKVDDILWRNREILLRFKGEVPIEELEKLGFKISYITHYVEKKSNTKEALFFCYIYDVSYSFINDKFIKILSHGK